MSGISADRSPAPRNWVVFCALAAILLFAFLLRASFALDRCWQQPYEPHHIDEQFLPYEAIAMWEGVTPRELGWPATPTRFLLSVCYAVSLATSGDKAATANDGAATGYMDRVARWTSARIDDPTPIYAIGRWASAVIGTLQVVLAYWAVRRWLSPMAGLLAALMCAISPIAVTYSQYILADMTGVLFVTWLVGLLGTRNQRDSLWPMRAGILLALATASKCHLGIWLFPVLLAIWFTDEPSSCSTFRRRILDTVWVVAIFTVTLLLLVPWLWTNPMLMAKKFLGVVWSKMSTGALATSAGPFANVEVTFVPMGWLVLAGALPGLFLVWKLFGRRSLPVLVAIALGGFVIATAGEVYDRYGLLIFPAVVLVASAGFVGLWSLGNRILRAAVALSITGLTVITCWQLFHSQKYVGEVESYSQAHAWIMENLKPGNRIAIDQLYARRLPHTREQLANEIAARVGPGAYGQKMKSNGLNDLPGEPMRNAILNDELYDSFWLKRELGSRRSDEGFLITKYYPGPRFNCKLTDEVITEFNEGLSDPTVGYDALLLNRRADLEIEPAKVFKGGPGPRLYLYLRSPTAS